MRDASLRVVGFFPPLSFFTIDASVKCVQCSRFVVAVELLLLHSFGLPSQPVLSLPSDRWCLSLNRRRRKNSGHSFFFTSYHWTEHSFRFSGAELANLFRIYVTVIQCNGLGENELAPACLPCFLTVVRLCEVCWASGFKPAISDLQKFFISRPEKWKRTILLPRGITY